MPSLLKITDDLVIDYDRIITVSRHIKFRGEKEIETVDIELRHGGTWTVKYDAIDEATKAVLKI